MLKYIDTDIVFQELPDEVTLAVNLSAAVRAATRSICGATAAAS